MALVSGAIVALLGLAFAASAAIYWSVTAHGTFSAPAKFPAPRILQDQALERKELYSAQRQRLATYSWIDRANHIIAIPIERAIDILAQKGADGYAPIGQNATPPQSQAAAPGRAQEKALQRAEAKQSANHLAPPSSHRQQSRNPPHRRQSRGKRRRD